MRITNVKVNRQNSKEIIQSVSGKWRKKLIKMEMSGQTWQEKKDEAEEKIINVFGKIPDGISFTRRKTKKIKHNPDGLRLFIVCDWIKRNRFYDENGLFPMGSLIEAINLQIEGKTNKDIMVED